MVWCEPDTLSCVRLLPLKRGFETAVLEMGNDLLERILFFLLQVPPHLALGDLGIVNVFGERVHGVVLFELEQRHLPLLAHLILHVRLLLDGRSFFNWRWLGLHALTLSWGVVWIIWHIRVFILRVATRRWLLFRNLVGLQFRHERFGTYLRKRLVVFVSNVFAHIWSLKLRNNLFYYLN